jgi:hypothetical protein
MQRLETESPQMDQKEVVLLTLEAMKDRESGLIDYPEDDAAEISIPSVIGISPPSTDP